MNPLLLFKPSIQETEFDLGCLDVGEFELGGDDIGDLELCDIEDLDEAIADL